MASTCSSRLQSSADKPFKRCLRWDNHVLVSTSEVETIETKKYDDILSVAEDHVALALHNGLDKRYQRKTSIYIENGCPSSYCYSDSEKCPPKAAHFPVAIDETFSRPRFDRGTEKMWLELKELELDKLYILLMSGLSVSKSVFYDKRQKRWVRQVGHLAGDTENFTLKYYVHPFPDPEFTLLEFLKRGRTQDEMKRCVANLVRSQFSLNRLDIAWTAALVSGLTESTGHSAVFQLLDAIVALVPGLEISKDLPAVFVVRFAFADSATMEDICDSSSRSSSSSSHSVSNSSDECASPDVKRKKTDKKLMVLDKTNKRRTAAKTITEDANIRTPRHPHDLSIITIDDISGVCGYLFLVEIHSPGKTFLQATQMFMWKMIDVLQAQHQVFGLFFSKLTVLLYSAEKGLDGTVTISKEEYTLLKFSREEENFDYDIFCVPHFQKLIMDVFSCVVHGLKNIGA